MKSRSGESDFEYGTVSFCEEYRLNSQLADPFVLPSCAWSRSLFFPGPIPFSCSGCWYVTLTLLVRVVLGGLFMLWLEVLKTGLPRESAVLWILVLVKYHVRLHLQGHPEGFTVKVRYVKLCFLPGLPFAFPGSL